MPATQRPSPLTVRCRAATVAAIVSASLGAGLPAPEAASAARFACGGARTRAEHLICSDAALGARDKLLAGLTAAALRRDADGRIRIRQRAWLATTAACETATCLALVYDGRIGALLRTEGGNAAAAHFYTDRPAGNHGTLDVVGPVHGLAAVSLTSTFVGPGGAAAGDITVAAIGGVLDLRRGSDEIRDGTCRVRVRPRGAESWAVEQAGACDLPRGTVFGGTYRR
ncbi:MAG: hypothetical protein INR63_16300 [Actinomycetospora chiangmaiensis]|nr:hypothetical protein [Actinomycetospora chiangmaiensis]